MASERTKGGKEQSHSRIVFRARTPAERGTSGKAIYDIKDKDESENLLYTARAEDLFPIPPPGSQLPSFSPGKHVIALYPGTTTFYNAQVISLLTKRDVYNLKFEGEENEKEVKEVERRYVLDTKAK
jgi:SAGA-associated factor 29